MTADQIDLDIAVTATPREAWSLVGEPGWFINEGSLTPHEVSQDGDVVTVVDPACGTFRFRIEQLEKPHRIRYSSLDEVGQGRAVEILVSPDGEGALIRVVESGFAQMQVPEEERAATYDENVRAWKLELGLAKERLEGR